MGGIREFEEIILSLNCCTRDMTRKAEQGGEKPFFQKMSQELQDFRVKEESQNPGD